MLNKHIRAFFLVLFFALNYSYSFGQISGDKKTYTVQMGETFFSIADKLGDRSFWEPIYLANADHIDGGLKTGQVLELPPLVTNSPEFVYSTNSDSLLVADSTRTQQSTTLEEFRTAFNKTINQQNNSNSQENTKQADPALEFEGMVLDETRSKMGRDFYDTFYQNWEKPGDAYNFTITITEQPSFGRGTQISIKLDYEQVFTARLQPKYDYIEAVSQQAIKQCQAIIRQRASVKNQLSGY